MTPCVVGDKLCSLSLLACDGPCDWKSSSARDASNGRDDRRGAAAEMASSCSSLLLHVTRQEETAINTSGTASGRVAGEKIGGEEVTTLAWRCWQRRRAVVRTWCRELQRRGGRRLFGLWLTREKKKVSIRCKTMNEEDDDVALPHLK